MIPASVVFVAQSPPSTQSPTHRSTTTPIVLLNRIQTPSAPSSISSSHSPPILQSQARALSHSQDFANIVLAATNCPSPTPVAHKTRRRKILSPPPRPPPPPLPISPYTSPTTPTGAISKRSRRRATPYTIPVLNPPAPSQP